MAEDQQAMFGHKVIFLNPDFTGHGEVFKKLAEDEYEVYFIDDYRDAKNVLREYKNSICIVYADDSTTKRAMINLMVSCAKDESLSSTIFYMITSDLNIKEKKALEGAKPCFESVIAMNPRTAFLIQAIEARLEEKNAKGRRQYVRVSCADDKEAIALAEKDGRLYKFKMHDISIVGSACAVESKFAQFFQKGTVISSVNFTLAGKQIAVGEVAVYTTFAAGSVEKLILLFKNPLSGENKDFVHNYIREKFDSDIHTIIKSRPRDEENYTKAFAEGENEAQ